MEVWPEQKKGDPEVAVKRGGFRTMPFIIANETFEKVANAGLQVNMILYLINEYHFEPAKGAIILFLWAAVSNFMPVIGAILSDAYLGRFRVIAFGTVITLMGLIVLWFTAIIPKARPPSCKMFREECESAKPYQIFILLSSFALMSIGAGGIRPCSMAFAADQINNPENPNNERLLQSFFNWYYVSVGLSIMVSIVAIVYIQEKAGWVVGLGVPVGLMFFSTTMFFLGSSRYVRMQSQRSLFSSFAKVLVAVWRNRNLDLPPRDSNQWHFLEGSALVVPTDKFRQLNKACVIRNPEKELDSKGLAMDPWSLCTVKQVEELKAIIKVMPIWSTGILVAVTISQASFTTVQASTMDRHISPKFQMPSSSFGVFTILTLTLWVATYDRIVVPLLSKFKRGVGLKQRMGMGVAVSCSASLVAALVERKRRNTAILEGRTEQPQEVVSMSAMWLVPQFCLFGLAEAFNAIGQIEFYYSQLPKKFASIGVALFGLGMAVGNLISALLVKTVSVVSERGGKVGWLAKNINKGHYDYYYGLLAFLSAINLVYYLICGWAYGSTEDIKDWGEEEEELLVEEELYSLDISVVLRKSV